MIVRTRETPENPPVMLAGGNGNPSSVYGAGGGWALPKSSTAYTGGNGSGGAIIVWEYI
jgi:hypothetical protein